MLMQRGMGPTQVDMECAALKEEDIELKKGSCTLCITDCL